MYQVKAVQVACLITGDLTEAEDIVQAAFLRVYEKIAGFNPDLPFKPWFMQMVITDSLKIAIKNKRQFLLREEDEFCQDILERLSTTITQPEDIIQRKELVEEMQLAMDRLSPTQRAAIVMHYFLDVTTIESALQLNCAPGTLRWHLSMARERLRTLLTVYK